MATATADIDIQATRAQILDVLADLPHYPEWSAVHKRASILERDAHGRPKRAKMSVAAGGLADQQTLDYKWRADGVQWSLVRSTQQRKQAGRYSIRPARGGGSHVHYELTIDPAIPVPGFLVRVIMRKAVTAATEGLKRRVEATPGG
jgi:hypothetical protein